MDWNTDILQIKQAGGSFTIPQALKDKYKITNSLADVDSWLAQILLNNSASDGDKKGGWNEIGYVGISLSSNVIVPIARADEHQAGYELLNHLSNKGIISGEYVTVNNGRNFWYGKEDLPKYKVALSKWIAFGGNPSITLEPMNSEEGQLVKAIDFVNDTNIKQKKVKKQLLKPQGKLIVSLLENFATTYRSYLNEPPISYSKRAMLNKMIEVGNQLKAIDLDDLAMGFDFGRLDYVVDGENEESVQHFADIILGSNGLKNNLHMALKSYEPDMPYSKLYQRVYGNIDYAIDQFNALGNI